MPRKTEWQTIHIHASAPEKPAMGAPCNGCSVCCAAEPCPVSLAFLWPHQTPCRALVWQADTQRYACGMLQAPARYIPWLPYRLNAWFGRRVARWIAAGQGCDADVSLPSPNRDLK